MSIDVVGNEKPVYYEGQEVLFNLNGNIEGTGVISGRGAAEGIVDMWIVKIKSVRGLRHADYPWSCVVMSHHQIRPDPNASAAFRIVKLDPDGGLADYVEDAFLGATLTNASICCKNCTIVTGTARGNPDIQAALGVEVEPLNKAAEDILAAAKAAHPDAFETR